MDERVLLVEDNASIREVTALGLRRAGFRVTTAGEGRSGLAQARQPVYDLVILDVMLPELDGFEVCRELRRLPGERAPSGRGRTTRYRAGLPGVAGGRLPRARGGHPGDPGPVRNPVPR